MEVKNANARSNQLMSDKCKIAMYLKKMIDEQVAFGVKSPVAIGMKVEGNEVEIYIGKLEHEGIYQISLDSQFNLPRNYADICSIPYMMRCLLTVNEILKDLTERIKDHEDDDSSNTPTNWRRPSFDWPTQD